MLTENEARELLYNLRKFINSGRLWLLFRACHLPGFLWRNYRQKWTEWGFCPWCLDDSIDWMRDPWFEATGGGESYVPGEPITHWGEGIQTCPRCRYKWFLQASD